MGMLAAEWITKGETQYDMFAWDLTRFGDWCSDAFTKERVRDQYANRFKIHFPGHHVKCRVNRADMVYILH